MLNLGGEVMNKSKRLMTMKVQQAFHKGQDILFEKPNIILNSIRLYYLDCCGREHLIKDPFEVFICDGKYSIKYKYKDKNIDYLVKYLRILEETSLELSPDEVDKYMNKNGSLSIPNYAIKDHEFNNLELEL